MRLLNNVLAGFGITLAVGTSFAAMHPNADELGKSLTDFGAEKAANADNTIPAYKGGLPASTAPAGWKKGSGRYATGPFDNEKPLFTINAGNADKYADRLTAGTVAMLKKYPAFRVDVYPTHRSISYSDDWLSHCKENAANSKITKNGNGISGAHSCVPFPVPSSGAEIIWNHELRNTWGVSAQLRTSTWLVDGSGHLTDIGHTDLDYAHPYLDPKATQTNDDVYEYRTCRWLSPSSQVGTKILQQFPLDYDKQQQLSWVYTPGQRRTRLAPEFAYDTPIASNGGALNYDEPYGFTGQLDRYDFKTVGKKEMYVPYNPNRMLFAPLDKMLTQNFYNPDVTRWELHRVWVVEATLKEGKRHTEPRRTFYVDEDSWAIVASDAYDQGGNLTRIGFFPVLPMWDVQTTAQGVIFYDFSKGTTYISTFVQPDDYVKASDDMGNLGRFTPSALTSSGIR